LFDVIEHFQAMTDNFIFISVPEELVGIELLLINQRKVHLTFLQKCIKVLFFNSGTQKGEDQALRKGWVFDYISTFCEKQERMLYFYKILAEHHLEQRLFDIGFETTSDDFNCFFGSEMDQVIIIVEVIRKIHRVIQDVLACQWFFTDQLFIDFGKEIVNFTGKSYEI
jgi:hypothetical protein